MEKLFRISLAFCLLLSASTHAIYPEYQTYSHQDIKGDGIYLWYLKKIKNLKEIKTIFEIGSRDGIDAIELSDLFRCHVFAFECNPVAIEICKKNISSNPNVTLVPFGVWNMSGEMEFYRVIDGNIGASSFFKFNPNARNYPNIVGQGLVQEKIIVPTIRLDEFLQSHGIENIDLLCMDVQGAAFQVLDSLGDQLQKIKYIIVELGIHPIYSGEILYKEVDFYLTNYGFIRASDALDPEGLFGDVLYIHKSVL